ncbi:hypothetical protein AAIH37_34760, partial [Pseudomonas aeruginosa]
AAAEDLARTRAFTLFATLSSYGRPPASLFHAHFFKRFPQLISSSSGLKEWWVAPRGEAKSSLLTKVGPCYVVVQGLLQRPEIRAELGMTGPAPYFVDYITTLAPDIPRLIVTPHNAWGS